MAYIAGKHIVRSKNPEVDLKVKYRKTFQICTGITFVLHVLAVVLFPIFQVGAAASRADQVIIQMEDIPETRQIQRPPPPPRPAVPIETESEDVPDDVTIEDTSLDFDEVPVDLPPPPPPGSEAPPEEEEEVYEFYALEQQPKPVKQPSPVYPELARKAGLEGQVFVQFVVGRDGRVREATVIRGHEIFRQAAIDAVLQWVYKPAIQNDKPVSVRMTVPVKFTLQ
jgi:protein TonB